MSPATLSYAVPNLYGQSFLSMTDATPDQVKAMLALAIKLKADKRSGTAHRLLAGKHIALYFRAAQQPYPRQLRGRFGRPGAQHGAPAQRGNQPGGSRNHCRHRPNPEPVRRRHHDPGRLAPRRFGTGRACHRTRYKRPNRVAPPLPGPGRFADRTGTGRGTGRQNLWPTSGTATTCATA
ncbi:MAG: hypothetical protein R2857_04730 [Vampirovibrionales bacterium]